MSVIVLGASASPLVGGSSPAATISLTPSNAALNPSQTQTFTPVMSGVSNSALTWSISPAVGSISSSGVYTAPALPAAQKVIVTATSASNPAMSASAQIAFLSPYSAPPSNPDTPPVSSSPPTSEAPVNSSPPAASNPSSSTYYVDNVSGSDSNDGSSPSSPFATIAKVNSLMLQGGQSVAFKAGDHWHEQLNVSQSGTSGAQITYTSYGNGPQPVIDASDTVTGWTRGGGVAAQETCPSSAFCSGFETSAFADWNGISNFNDATVTVSNAQSHRGVSSMALSSTTGIDTRGWVTKSIPAVGNNSTLAVRWYFLAPPGSMKPNSSIRILCLSSGATQVGFATLATNASGNPSAIDFYDTENSIRVLNSTPLAGYIPGGWNEMELDISVSNSAGGGTFYLNGQKLSQINTADTHAEGNINSIAFGNSAYGGAIAPGGTVYFDDFKTSDSPNIGPFSAGIPTNVWYRNQPTDPRLINFSGQAGSPVFAMDSVAAPYQFYWDGAKLYVYSQSDPTPVVEVPQRSYALASPGASYITVSGLQLQGAQQSDLFCTYICSYWTVSNNTINASYSTALFFEVDGQSSVAGVSILNNEVTGNGAGGIQVNNGIGLVTIVGNEVQDFAKIYNPIYGTQNQFADGIEMCADGKQGTGYVAYNYVHNGGLGNAVSYGGGIHADTVAGMDIEHNTIENVNSSGIQLEKSSGSIARYNLVVNGGVAPYASGLFIRAGEGTSVSNQLAEYNTIYGGWWGCTLQISQDGAPVTATDITIQKNICTGASSGTQFYGDIGAVNSGNVILGNSFGLQGTNFIIFNGKLLSTYSDFDAAAGYATDSVQGIPQFVNPVNGNFSLQPASAVLGIGAFP